MGGCSEDWAPGGGVMEEEACGRESIDVREAFNALAV